MWYLVFVCLFSSLSAVTSAGCSISTNNDLGEPQPLIVNLDYTIRHPQTTDVVSFVANEQFFLSCPRSYLRIQSGNNTINFAETENATCISGNQFRVQNTTSIFTNITCNQYPYHTARGTNETCEESNQELEVGFLIDSTFIRHLRICFDNRTHVTKYSHFEMLPNIRGRQSGFPRPSWINGDFYSFGGNSSNNNANSLVTVINQIATISKLIGYNDSTSNPYVNSTADLYLARGHLTAKADFVFGAQQRLTFHMVNAAPQWQTFNGGNWAKLEDDARNLAINSNLTLQTYTGTYGVMTLPHVTRNESVRIYLYNDDRGNQEFPVPLLYWKFLYEPIAQAGIVLVGVNDPYIRNVSEAIICTDIYDRIKWNTTFSRNDTLNGYMYSCAPDEFRKTVTHMPNVTVKSLLVLDPSDPGKGSSLTGLLNSVSCIVVITLYLTVYVNIW